MVHVSVCTNVCACMAVCECAGCMFLCVRVCVCFCLCIFICVLCACVSVLYVHVCRHLKTANSSSWGGSPTSFFNLKHLLNVYINVRLYGDTYTCRVRVPDCNGFRSRRMIII